MSVEEVCRRLGFIEWDRMPRRLKEPWGEQKVFDEVYFLLAPPSDSQEVYAGLLVGAQR